MKQPSILIRVTIRIRLSDCCGVCRRGCVRLRCSWLRCGWLHVHCVWSGTHSFQRNNSPAVLSKEQNNLSETRVLCARRTEQQLLALGRASISVRAASALTIRSVVSIIIQRMQRIVERRFARSQARNDTVRADSCRHRRCHRHNHDLSPPHDTLGVRCSVAVAARAVCDACAGRAETHSNYHDYHDGVPAGASSGRMWRRWLRRSPCARQAKGLTVITAAPLVTRAPPCLRASSVVRAGFRKQGARAMASLVPIRARSQSGTFTLACCPIAEAIRRRQVTWRQILLATHMCLRVAGEPLNRWWWRRSRAVRFACRPILPATRGGNLAGRQVLLPALEV